MERPVDPQTSSRIGAKPKLLLHICCAPCSTYVLELLRRDFQVTAFFYNPNIYPPQERLRRAEETQDLCRRMGIEVICVDEDADVWARRMSGRGLQREGGTYCSVCYWIRLARTAAEARKRGLGYFTTTLSVSPHKNAEIINRMGQKAARRAEVAFYTADFKKGDGFKTSCQLSREYGLYRQDYCGCVYSLRERRAGRTAAPGATRPEKEGGT